MKIKKDLPVCEMNVRDILKQELLKQYNKIEYVYKYL